MDSELEEIEWDDKISTCQSQRSERSRSATPKWWRPSYPPETYEWEEMRRKRKLGGYPWTHLDKKTDKGNSDNVYEAVTPGKDFYGSGFVGGDPETSSLDRHTFYVPPELDIVTSDGLDGLDQPDSQDFGMDGDKEWSLYDIEKPKQKQLFAGIRVQPPKVGETSSIRPLKNENLIEPVPSREHEYELTEPRQSVEQEGTMETRHGSVSGDDPSGKPKTRFPKFSLPVRRPKLGKLPSFKFLKKNPKEKENQESEASEPPPEVPTPKGSRMQVREVKIKFDDTLDLSLRPEPKPSGSWIHEEEFEPVEPPNKEEDDDLDEDTLKLEELIESQQEEEGRIREEAKRLKEDKESKQREGEAEAKRIKAEQKEAKEREKALLKRLKAEEKERKQQEEAEVKGRKQREEAEAKERKRREAIEAKEMKQILAVEVAERKQREAAEAAERKQIQSVELAERKQREAAEAAERKQREAVEVAERKQIQSVEVAERKQREADEAAERKQIEAAEAAERKQREAVEVAERKQIQSVIMAERKQREAAEAAEAAERKQREAAERKQIEAAEVAERKQRDAAEAAERKQLEEAKEKRVKEESKLYRSEDLEEAVTLQKQLALEAVVKAKEFQKQAEGSDDLLTKVPLAQPTPAHKSIMKPPRNDVTVSEDDHVYDLEAHVMNTILSQEAESPSESKSPTKVQLLKQKLGQIRFKKRFKRKSRTPPLRPSPPRFKVTPLGETELSLQYQREMEQRIDLLEEAHAHAQERKEPEPLPIAPAPPPKLVARLEPSIYVTSPSIETADREGSEESGISPGPPEPEPKSPIGQRLKGFGQKSRAAAARASNRVKSSASTIGSDLKKIGGKMNFKYHEALKEIREREEVRRKAQEEKEAMSQSGSVPGTPAQNVFRFKRKGKKTKRDPDPEPSSPPVIVAAERKKKKPYYENSEPVSRSGFLGHADRDYRDRSADFEPSRESSEEPNFSAHAPSPWESTGGLSAASSSARSESRGHQGVLEEIDSDEFFLREKGISEGEDEVEMSRFLLSELRQAFRPTHVNALRTLETQPPQRPVRAFRKSRMPKPNFQTFPPERPKRKGRRSPYDMSAEIESLDKELSSDDDSAINEDTVPHYKFEPPSDDDEDEGIRKVKAQLRKIDEDERYEPVKRNGDRPRRPSRKPKPKRNSPPKPQCYKTVSAEWTTEDDLDLELLTQALKSKQLAEKPIRPKRGSQKSLNVDQSNVKPESSIASAPDQNQLSAQGPTALGAMITDDHLDYADEAEPEAGPLSKVSLALGDSTLFEDLDDDDLDGNGYAVVARAPPPATVPRRKRKAVSQSKPSKRNSREIPPATCSLPRFPPRTFHTVPPTRPQRTYATLRPKRPPRKKVKGYVQNEKSSTESPKQARPSSSIMRDRPLPPPPKPPRPASWQMNDLDQETVSESIGLRHYVNYDPPEQPALQRAVVEEVCTAKNIPLLGNEEQDSTGIGIQTDPLSDEDFDYRDVHLSSSDDVRVQNLTDSMEKLSSVKVPSETETGSAVMPRRSIDSPQKRHSNGAPTQIIFPSRLHLDELEVDFLRVTELSAQTLSLDRLHSSNLQVDNVSCTGTLSVGSVDTSISPNPLTPTLSANNELDSVPPPSFYQLASPAPRSPARSPPAVEALPEDDPVDLGMRLGRSLLRSGLRAINGLMETLERVLPPDEDGEQKQRLHLQVMLCVLLLLVAGIFILTRYPAQPPHWEFYLPPNDML